MHYNLMFYKPPSAPCSSVLSFQQKDAAFKTIFDAVQPDILTVNELGAFQDNSAAQSVLTNVINTQAGRHYTAAAYSNNSFSSITNMLFYDSTQFALHSQFAITNGTGNQTLVRVIDFYRLYHKNGFTSAGDTTFFTVVVAHFKAGSSTRDQTERRRAAEAVMNTLQSQVPDDAVIMAGDFNIRSANESSYQELTTGTSSTGLKLNDPVNFPGSWNNNATYAPLHTQSTHSSSSGCKVGGGLDDRFDFILISDSIKDDKDRISYVLNSYTTIGNDGNKFNTAINQGSNASVSSAVLQALFDFSDHLPITAEFAVDLQGVGLSANLLQSLRYNNPVRNNELHLRTTGRHGTLHWRWVDLTGKVLMTRELSARAQHWRIPLEGFAPGVYLMQISDSQTGAVRTYKVVKS